MPEIRFSQSAIAWLMVACMPLMAGAQPGLPGAPSNFQVTVSGNTLTLTWGAPTTGGAPTNYQIVARTTTGALITTQNAWPTPSFVGAVPNGTYVLSVQAQNAVGFGPETLPRTVTVPAGPTGGPGAPGPPTGLQATVSGNTASVSWGPPASGGAPTNYLLIARTQAGAVLATQNVWPNPSFVASLPNGVYFLSVQASNASGPGPETSPVTLTVPSTPPPGPGAPGVPTNFQAGVSGNTLSLSWAPPASGASVTGYTVIARSTAGAVIASQGVGNSTSFVGAVPNGVYVLSVQASNSSGPGPETAPRTITVPTATQLPGAPRNLSATAAGSTITIAWTPPASGGTVVSYVIRASTTPGGAPAAELTVAGNVTQTAVPGAPAGTFYFAVIAVNGAGASPPSNTASVTVGPPSTSRSTLNPPGVPSSVQAWGSQIYGTGQSPYKTFDDFTFTAGSTIRQIAWQGIYCVAQNGAAAPAPVASSFVISIHADQAGRPNTGAPIATVPLSAAQTNQTFNGNFPGATCSGATNTTWALYSYSVVLPAAFTASPGVRYWLSVQAVTPSAAVEWGWRSGTTDTSSTVSLYLGSIYTTTLDRAFALTP